MPAIKCIALSNSDQTNEIASYYVVCANNETPRLLSSDLIQIILLVVKQLKLQSGIQGSSKHARNSAKKKRSHLLQGCKHIWTIPRSLAFIVRPVEQSYFLLNSLILLIRSNVHITYDQFPLIIQPLIAKACFFYWHNYCAATYKMLIGIHWCIARNTHSHLFFRTK